MALLNRAEQDTDDRESAARMAHYIQAIVARQIVVDSIRHAEPRLQMIPLAQDFALCPVSGEFVETVTGSAPPQETETFVDLTAEFTEYLRRLSRLGRIAYVETEYQGGTGGQGAAVFDSEAMLMEPTWRDSGAINAALKILGVKQDQGDEFSAIGLQNYRSLERWLPICGTGR